MTNRASIIQVRNDCPPNQSVVEIDDTMTHELPATKSTHPTRIKRALVSVSDKTHLVVFAQRLAKHGVQIISTGGTARALADAGIAVTPIDEITGFPEMMDGRVKTLHPRIHGGLLALRDNNEHTQAMAEHGIDPIDLVCVNLYPFEKTITRDGVTDEEAIEQIDIGGPSMVRSAAKNHRSVAVVTDPAQYERVADEIDQNNGATTLKLRTQLAAAAFATTAAYDTAIAAWMARYAPSDTSLDEEETLFPDSIVIRASRLAELRYGENPHQAAALYTDPTSSEANVATAQQLHGKQLSFNNLNDASAALELVKEFDAPAAAVIKHTNPCGCAVGSNLTEAFERAYAGDPLAAFGGIVAFNRPVDANTATLMTGPGAGGAPKFLEAIIAPSYNDDALKLICDRWKNVRVLAVGDLPKPDQRDTRQIDFRSITGGYLAQQRDLADMTSSKWQHVCGPKPDQATTASLHVAWCCTKHVKSNAIVLARDGALVGAGAGQMDRVESCKIAVAKANARGEQRSDRAVAGSDAFFPFRDGPGVLIDAGVKAIVQPGGSKRDDETITACEQAGVSLLFTGRRHFRH